jgi:hypothetical protein
MKPTIGRIVHFHQNNLCYAAIIVRVWSDSCVNIHVFPTGSDEPVPGAINSVTRVATSVNFDDNVHPKDWSWHWPKQEG